MVGCKSNQQKAGMAESNAKPTVTVTIPPYQYFVDKIAGDKVDVNVMVSNGNNPETYEPYAQQMMELSKSALYLKVGSIGFEQTWMKKLQDNAPDMKVIDTSVGIKPAQTPGGNIDPHVWMSCKKRPHHRQQHAQGTLRTGAKTQDFLREELQIAAQHHRQERQHHQGKFQREPRFGTQVCDLSPYPYLLCP